MEEFYFPVKEHAKAYCPVYVCKNINLSYLRTLQVNKLQGIVNK